MAQPNPDRPFIVLDSDGEEIGGGATWQPEGVLSQLKRPGGTWHDMRATGKSGRSFQRGAFSTTAWVMVCLSALSRTSLR